MNNIQQTFSRGLTLLTVGVSLLLGVAFNDAQAQVPSDIVDFTSHGVHVILRNTQANDVVGVFLGIEGGLAYGETENASIASSVSRLISTSGSSMYPKVKYRDTL